MGRYVAGALFLPLNQPMACLLKELAYCFTTVLDEDLVVNY